LSLKKKRKQTTTPSNMLDDHLRSLRSSDNTTSLISLWLPFRTNLDDVQRTLRREQKVAKNIKNRNHARAMIHALKRVSERLSTAVKQVPRSGLALYAGQWV
jgi:peptide subunit release factor 1 (eRF1)